MAKYEIVNDNGEGIYEVKCEKSLIHYYVNEKKKTVVAVMDYCNYQFEKEIINFLDQIIPSNCATCFGCYNLPKIRKTYRGKAHCIGSDKFDLETGMRIARENMLVGYYTDYAKAALEIYDGISEGMDKLATHIGVIGQRLEKFADLASSNYSAAEGYKNNFQDK